MYFNKFFFISGEIGDAHLKNDRKIIVRSLANGANHNLSSEFVETVLREILVKN